MSSPGRKPTATSPHLADTRHAARLTRPTHEKLAGMIGGGTAGDGSLYLVMHYIDGVPLDLHAATLGEQGRESLLRLFAKICRAADDAHRHGVIHRDLKPSNIRVDLG